MKTHKQLKQELIQGKTYSDCSECITIAEYGNIRLIAMSDCLDHKNIFVNYEVGFWYDWDEPRGTDLQYFNKIKNGINYSDEECYNQALEEFKFQALIHKGFKS